MPELTRVGKLVILGVAVPTSALILYWLLKKDDEDCIEDGTTRAATSKQTVIEIKVPRKDVGIVIGRQGATIKKLQDEHGTRMNFKDDPCGEGEARTMVIRGTPEAAQAAECAVRKLLADQPIIVQEEMLVPGYSVGRIIGRGGENIRQIDRSSQAKVFVDRTREGYRDKPRVITIKGTKEQIDAAKNMIQEVVQNEEEFRAKNAVAMANRETRKRAKDAKHELHKHVANTEVATMNETWDTHVADDGDRGDVAMTTRVQTTIFPQVEDYFEVFVSAVAHPSIFWVQQVSALGLKLDQLIQQMTRYYDTSGRNEVVGEITPGDLVAAPLDGDISWYRAKVMGVKDTQIDLFYVDYGDSVFMDKSKLRCLCPQFLTLPLQAIECRLAGVQPAGEWSEEAIEKFESLTYCAEWKVIMARPEQFTGQIPHLTLIDTSGDLDLNINKELIRLGYGVEDTDS